ncbi:MAG: hypothetical protein U1A73_12335 [Pseudomonas sp.]|nr:hypothetical protein [Pseudomonas sp.]
MASDEYAYLAEARYSETPDLVFQFDPGMQAVRNKVYPVLFTVWESISPRHAELVGRIFNSFLFVCGGFLLFEVFRRVFDRRSALISALLYLALPFSFYAITLLPEVEFQVSVYLVSLIVVLAGPRPPAWMVVVAASVCALGYFIKPHAAAMIAACAVYWFVTGLLEREATFAQRFMRGSFRAGLHLAVALTLIVVVGKIGASGSSAGGVVPSFYKDYLGQILSGGMLASRIGSLLDYLGGHLWVMAAYFTPGLIAVLLAVRTLLSRGLAVEGSAIDERRAYFALYVALMLLSFLAMVGLFTTSAAELSPAERFRLHGRYLAALMPMLLAFSVWASGRFRHRGVGILAVAAVVSFGLVGRTMYRLFPWDYPDAFGFFNPSAAYWSFDGELSWTLWVVLIAAVGCWIASLRLRSARIPFVVFTLVWMLASQAQMWQWLKQQSATTRAYVDSANAIEHFLGQVPVGSGLVLTEDRYGQTSSFLMGFDTLQRVLTVPDGKRVGNRDLPADIGWVVAPADVDVELEGAAELSFGNQRLFLLDGRYQWPHVGEKAPWNGKPIQIGTGAQGEPHRLHGFNPAESWGSWSKDGMSFVDLPSVVNGRVRVTFFAWMFETNPDRLLKITLGHDSRELEIETTGRDYQLELDAGSGDDRLMFESKIVRPAGEARALGLALGNVRIEKLPNSTDASPIR